MDFSRIANVIDILEIQCAHVAVFGVGASYTLLADLARCGVRRFTLADPDTIEPSNIARQGHTADQIGAYKVDAVAQYLRTINPEIDVVTLPMDCTTLSNEEIDGLFGDVDVFLFATDQFAVQAWGNTVALRLGKPAVWMGVYADGLGGEVIWSAPHVDACFRCLCAKRYQAHEEAEEGTSLDPPSDGVTIFDVAIPDAIAGAITIGLLTRGSDNRFGRLIDGLGDRNFIQASNDPSFRVAGRDVIREQLGIAEDCDTYFAWNSIARRDPDGGELYCPDCEKYRGHVFASPDGDRTKRSKPDESQTAVASQGDGDQFTI